MKPESMFFLVFRWHEEWHIEACSIYVFSNGEIKLMATMTSPQKHKIPEMIADYLERHLDTLQAEADAIELPF
jgi:hypothetical protein